MRNKVFHQFEWPPDVKEWNVDDITVNEFYVTYETHSFPQTGKHSQLLISFRRYYSFWWLFSPFREGVLDELLFLLQRVNISTIVVTLRRSFEFLDECHWIQKVKNKKIYCISRMMLECMTDCVHRFQTFYTLAAKLMFLWVDVFPNFLSSFTALDLVVCIVIDSNPLL